ncbi:serine/threonine-protein kinase [Nonomuraea sp. NPDC047529]|uniref:serine/threonine-protein kinase n=1 Tax=Nonomuraea sp. NPDC047529 TaxID=3155623 RepID=UPI0033E5A61A
MGSFHLAGRLGQGGQGVVYLGEDAEGGRAAVKVMTGEIDRSFARELAAARKVDEFCTARVLVADLDHDPPYVASEYIEGPTLHGAVGAAGPLRGAALTRLAIGTATALAAIHRAGVVHRDFKPGNVLLGPDGPRVIDFGIARLTDATATRGGAVGTPPYMSPEQFSGETAGPASDVFAWGATITYAGTGRPPFGTAPFAAVAYRILHEQPDLGDLPDPLRSIVAHCLAKPPDARPTARSLLLHLLGDPTPSPPAPVAPDAADRGPAGTGAAGGRPVATDAAEGGEVAPGELEALGAGARADAPTGGKDATTGDAAIPATGKAAGTTAPPSGAGSPEPGDESTGPRDENAGAGGEGAGGISRRGLLGAGAALAGTALAGGVLWWRLPPAGGPGDTGSPASEGATSPAHGGTASPGASGGSPLRITGADLGGQSPDVTYLADGAVYVGRKRVATDSKRVVVDYLRMIVATGGVGVVLNLVSATGQVSRSGRRYSGALRTPDAPDALKSELLDLAQWEESRLKETTILWHLDLDQRNRPKAFVLTWRYRVLTSTFTTTYTRWRTGGIVAPA